MDEPLDKNVFDMNGTESSINIAIAVSAARGKSHDGKDCDLTDQLNCDIIKLKGYTNGCNGPKSV